MVSKYMPERNTFSQRCLVSTCDEPVVTCHAILPDGKECGLKGHPDVYKHDDIYLIPVVEHVHFHTDRDRARNCFHNMGEDTMFEAPEDMKIKTWRTPRRKERWEKIPIEVKQGLLWVDKNGNYV